MSEFDATIGYLRQRHKAISAQIETYTTPGNGAPGFVQQLQADLRGIEDALVKLLGPLRPEAAHADTARIDFLFDRMLPSEMKDCLDMDYNHTMTEADFRKHIDAAIAKRGPQSEASKGG